jgi:hypothetical protein
VCRKNRTLLLFTEAIGVSCTCAYVSVKMTAHVCNCTSWQRARDLCARVACTDTKLCTSWQRSRALCAHMACTMGMIFWRVSTIHMTCEHRTGNVWPWQVKGCMPLDFNGVPRLITVQPHSLATSLFMCLRLQLNLSTMEQARAHSQ